MSEWPKLNFPKITLKARRTGDEVEIFHPGRGIWLKLTPEEWVRRHLVAWLEGLGTEPQRIIEEYPVLLNGQPQRADVVVVDKQGRPRLVAECKAADVTLSQQTLDQIVRYNSVLGAEYLLLSNGLNHYFYQQCREGGYTPLKRPPQKL